MATTEVPATEHPTHVRWYVFSLAFATSFLLYLHRYVFAFIKPTLADEWGLSATELGKIDSAFSLCYSLIQFPLGVGADVLGVRLLLSVLMLVSQAILMVGKCVAKTAQPHHPAQPVPRRDEARRRTLPLADVPGYDGGHG